MTSLSYTIKEYKKYLLALTLFFVFSRIVLYKIGIRFISNTITNVQFIDPFLLKNSLLESLIYLHSQPPLFNSFLGVMLKFFPNHYHAVCHGIYLFLGLTFILTLFILMIRLKANTIIAMILTMFFAVHPSVIIYENWLFYTYPSAVILCLSALMLECFLSTKCRRFGYVFFILLAVLVLLRSTFHLVWFLMMVALLMCIKKKDWKQIIAVSLGPFIIVSMIYVKNAVLFGEFTLSPVWASDAMVRTTMLLVPADELTKLVRQKKISVYSPYVNEEFVPAEVFAEAHAAPVRAPHTGIPVLDQKMRPSLNLANWHSLERLYRAKQQKKDIKYVFRHYPGAYFRLISNTMLLSFFPGPTDMTYKNRSIIAQYEDIYNFMFYHLNAINSGKLYSEKLFKWNLIPGLKWDGLSYALFSIRILYCISLVFWGLKIAVDGLSKETSANATHVVLIFVCINIIYLTIGTNMCAWWGSNRYRFIVDSFYLVLSALALTMIKDKFHRGAGRSF